MIEPRAVTRPLVIALGLLIAAWFAPAANAFHLDTHYHLRYTLALSTCFDWDEAHLIASGDWMIDQNATTVAEMNPIKKANKIRWHAFGHREERLNDLWMRVASEPDRQLRLVKLGQLMHFLEDWEAHAGFGVRLGHARATLVGKDPDSLGRSSNRNQAAIQTGLVHLIKLCRELDRSVAGTTDPDLALARLLDLIEEDGLLQDLYQRSDPKWLKGNARLGEKGKAILAGNQLRAESFIERYLVGSAQKQIPPGFVPGDPDHGIPAPLRMKFSSDGELELPPGQETARGAEAALAMASINLVEMLPRAATYDLELEITGAEPEPDGWRIRLQLANLGPYSSEAGFVEVFVTDIQTEEVLGEASIEVAKLGAGEILSTEVLVPGSVSTSRVVIGAFAAIDDSSAENNQSLHELGDGSQDDQGLQRFGEKPRGPGSEEILLAGEPKVLLLGEQSLCALLRVRTTGGDSSEKLGPIELAILDKAAEPIVATEVTEPVWCAVESAADQHVVAQTVLCMTSERSLCPAAGGSLPAAMAVVVGSPWAASALEAERRFDTVLPGLKGACGSN